jgi:hypothetical protein
LDGGLTVARDTRLADVAVLGIPDFNVAILATDGDQGTIGTNGDGHDGRRGQLHKSENEK